jgi:hypothetical protein
MDHATFRKLVGEGEKPGVDFKIECHAFATKDTAPRAELAKDICAMANNGYVASYIIIGVSDDGTAFKGVSNRKLTDDNLQDFCKKAIFPPPKIRVHRETWKRVATAYGGKEFVIIQVGPQGRQAFRLAQDFISYEEKVCFRRNEVWIRRGATSDLATPEEICRLASGKPALVDEADEDREKDRQEFALKSEYERKSAVEHAAAEMLTASSYIKVREMDWDKMRTKELEALFPLFFHRSHALLEPYSYGMWAFHRKGLSTQPVQAFTKRTGNTIVFVLLWAVASSLPTKDLKFLQDYMHREFAKSSDIITALSGTKKRQIGAVRRILLLPVLGSVTANRIQKAIPSVRRAAPYPHYYRSNLVGPDKRRSDDWIVLPSSSELLIMDGIESVGDFSETLTHMLEVVEQNKDTVITPP